MMDKNQLYCNRISERITHLTNMKVHMEQRLEEASDEFEFRRDYDFYKELKSDLTYQHRMYKKDCLGFVAYWTSIFSSSQ